MERCVRAAFFLTTSVMLLLLAGGAPSTSGHELTPIPVSAFAPDSPTVLARATGSFEAAGLDATVSLTPSSTEQMRGLSNGTYDLANREVLVSFLKARREAGESMQTDSDSAAQLVANELGQPVETARAQFPTGFNRGELNLVGLQSVLDLRNQFGYALPMGPDLATYVDTSFWQETLEVDLQSGGSGSPLVALWKGGFCREEST